MWQIFVEMFLYFLSCKTHMCMASELLNPNKLEMCFFHVELKLYSAFEHDFLLNQHGMMGRNLNLNRSDYS